MNFSRQLRESDAACLPMACGGQAAILQSVACGTQWGALESRGQEPQPISAELAPRLIPRNQLRGRLALTLSAQAQGQGLGSLEGVPGCRGFITGGEGLDPGYWASAEVEREGSSPLLECLGLLFLRTEGSFYPGSSPNEIAQL